ncbi:hypothetical protein [Leuconostoc miyukkimchii]|uniref:hypothetical protein n=1 Tax=Leuconostoc miyukkimchii TaxID=910540 RepID=UPI001C7E027A|nr:hypothetical protein [Leuconostoc miyukkimchii]
MKKIFEFIGAIFTAIIGLLILIPILLTIIGVAVPVILSIIAVVLLVLLVIFAIGGVATLITIWRIKRHIKKSNGVEFVHKGKNYNIYMSRSTEKNGRRDVTDDD